MENGWIKLNRKILEWGWYKDTNTKAVFLHLLITANSEDKEFKGEVIHRGDLAISISGLAESVGITYDQARTALKHLESTQEVTIKRRPKHLVISITNYNRYQSRPNHVPIKNGEDSVKKSGKYENRPNQIPIKTSSETVGNCRVSGFDGEGSPTHHPNQIPIKSQTNPNQIPTTKEYKNIRNKDTPYSPPNGEVIDWEKIETLRNAGKRK